MGGSEQFDVLIVGTGHAGAQAAIALRQRGYAGSIGLLGEEPCLPYERPPLSKDYLTGDRPADRILLRQPRFWVERAIALMPGRTVIEVEPDAHRVRTAAGATIGYGTLIWAAGGAARRLSCDGNALAGVHTLRTLDDADRIRAELPDVANVAIVGGGYVGLETAAVMIGLGKRVTVIEATDRVLSRVAGASLSRFYEGEHRARGVDVRTGVAISAIEGSDGRACAVRSTAGERIACEMVVVGIGMEPRVAPLIAAGALGGNGVAVDAHCATSLPDILAIGDCAEHANAFAPGRRIRLESVQNANDQAVTVAKALTGAAEPYRVVPWFWSNQYDLKLQTVGLSVDYDTEIVRGDPQGRSFSVVYLRDRRVIALDCVNRVRDYVQGRALVETGALVDPSAVAEPSVELKMLAD